MKTRIIIPSNIYKKLQHHLMPKIQSSEEAAFVFSAVTSKRDQIEFNYLDWYALQPEDFENRSSYHFEISHETYNTTQNSDHWLS